MVIPLADIKSVSLMPDNKGETEKTTDNELLKIGRSKQHNISIICKQPIKYWGMMGAFVESFEQVLINVEQPDEVIKALAEINSPLQQLA